MTWRNLTDWCGLIHYMDLMATVMNKENPRQSLISFKVIVSHLFEHSTLLYCSMYVITDGFVEDFWIVCRRGLLDWFITTLKYTRRLGVYLTTTSFVVLVRKRFELRKCVKFPYSLQLPQNVLECGMMLRLVRIRYQFTFELQDEIFIVIVYFAVNNVA